MVKYYSEDDDDGSWTRPRTRVLGRREKKPKYGYLELKPANWLDSKRK